MDLDIFDFYDKMERSDVILSFKGEITSDLLTSILQIMESKLEDYQEAPKTKKRVYNVLVECLQNLYHHIDEIASEESKKSKIRNAIFMIAKSTEKYSIMTGNYIKTDNVEKLRERMIKINALSKDELKTLYKEILNNEEFSEKGGGGLGLIDIARRTGQELGFDFKKIDDDYSFFSLDISIAQQEDNKL